MSALLAGGLLLTTLLQEPCGGRCHEGAICIQIAKECERCKTGTAVCGAHSRFCRRCADEQKVCPYCSKPVAGSRLDPAAVLAVFVPKNLPNHRPGREIKHHALSAIPSVRFFTVIHGAPPCKTCQAFLEPLAAVEYAGDPDSKGTPVLILSEKDLSGLLQRHKPGGKEPADRTRAAVASATLVQALWRATQGGLRGVKGGKPVEPDQAAVEPRTEGWSAAFEFQKDKRVWSLKILFGKEGRFESFETADTGRDAESQDAPVPGPKPERKRFDPANFFAPSDYGPPGIAVDPRGETAGGAVQYDRF